MTAEVTPHHLYLGTREVEGYDTVFKVNPPLRTDEHIEAVREALADGTIDMVGTDHAPHARQDKDHPFDIALPGMLGLEQALAVVIEVMVKSGRLGWAALVDRMSVAPAALTRSGTQGRPIGIGEPANLVLDGPVHPSGHRPRDVGVEVAEQPLPRARKLPDPVVATVWAGRVTYGRDHVA